jgi:hypothetical protein
MTQKTDYRTMVEKDYLGQWDLEGRADAIVLIEKVEPYAPEKRKTKMVDGARVEEKNKRIKVTFRGKRKAWLAGPVSQKVIAGMYGRYVQDWIGKPIALYVDPTVQFGRETTGGIRVRPTPPTGKATTAPLDQPVDQAKAEQMARAATEAGYVDPNDDGR